VNNVLQIKNELFCRIIKGINDSFSFTDYRGFVLLIKGADWMVNGASALARKNNVSDLATGLTILAFGTSAPELVVNTVASFRNHSDIVFGNVIGSNF
jgi:cation:H+ antiporter